jgi:hypothetical protein
MLTIPGAGRVRQIEQRYLKSRESSGVAVLAAALSNVLKTDIVAVGDGGLRVHEVLVVASARQPEAHGHLNRRAASLRSERHRWAPGEPVSSNM